MITFLLLYTITIQYMADTNTINSTNIYKNSAEKKLILFNIVNIFLYYIIQLLS